MSEYTYSDISINADRLEREIENSEISAIFEGLTFSDSELSIFFNQSLDSNEESILDDIVTNHDATPQSPLKIWRYSQYGINHIDLDYITGIARRLYREETFVHGELRRVNFYADYNGTNPVTGEPDYSDLIIREDITYVRDAIGFARQRTTTITWYCEDGTAHPINKQLHKVYSSIESQKEGITRRGNVVDQALMLGVKLLIATEGEGLAVAITEGRELVETLHNEIDLFVIASKQDILAAIQAATPVWLDNSIASLGYPAGTTIRHAILDEVDIWGVL